MIGDEFRAFQQIIGRFNAVQIDEDLHLVERPEFAQQRIGSIKSRLRFQSLAG